MDYSLYAILDLAVVDPDRAPELAAAAVEGGATVIQVRGKEVAAAELLKVVEATAARLSPPAVPIIVNDRVDVAAVAGARGVHLGDEDLPLSAARDLLPNGILGRTVRHEAAARTAASEGADYLGVGSVFGSTTKGGVEVIGLDGLARVVRATPLPVVAIGGIDRERAASCFQAGAAGVAVVAALFGVDGGRSPSVASVVSRAQAMRAAIAKVQEGRR